MNNTQWYIILASLIVLTITIVYLIKKEKKRKKIINDLIACWGNGSDKKYESKDMALISSYFYGMFNNSKTEISQIDYSKLENPTNKEHYIDDITSNDLDMDTVFTTINTAHSTVGEEYLYYLLRKPETNSNLLIERERLISYFKCNPEKRLKLRYILTKLGIQRSTAVSSYFLEDVQDVDIKGKQYLFLALALALSPLLILFNPIGVLVIVALVIVNITIYYKTKNKIQGHLESLAYIVNLIKCSHEIAEAGIEEISEYSQKINKSYIKLKKISARFAYALFYRSEDPFLEYVKVVFLGEMIAFDRLYKAVCKYKDEIRVVYDIVGLLDSMISVASYREHIDYYCIPEHVQNTLMDEKILDFIKLSHPLIRKPVPNTAKIGSPVLLTGSNASGKSTFLKAIAINTILSQTIHTCLAEKFRASFYKIYTSMALRDDIFNKESYFIVEIKSLKRIFDSIEDNIPCLCIIDEVLRGTNTIERIAASSEVLCQLGKENCLCLAATHDIELSTILGSSYTNYHFREHITDKGIEFDYKLHHGQSTTRNAIKLLKHLGYKDSIVDEAEQRAINFINNRIWEQIEEQTKEQM